MSGDTPRRQPSFDLADIPADFYDDPYPTYAALREHSPRHRMRDGSVFFDALR